MANATDAYDCYQLNVFGSQESGHPLPVPGDSVLPFVHCIPYLTACRIATLTDHFTLLA